MDLQDFGQESADFHIEIHSQIGIEFITFIPNGDQMRSSLSTEIENIPKFLCEYTTHAKHALFV